MKKHTAKALVSSLLLAVALTVFPVISGVIITINKIDIIPGHLIQGAFMMLSLLIPVIFMRIRNIRSKQIGFKWIEQGSGKIALFFCLLSHKKQGFSFLE